MFFQVVNDKFSRHMQPPEYLTIDDRLISLFFFMSLQTQESHISVFPASIFSIS